MAPPDPDFRAKLTGTWECLTFELISTTDPKDVVYPLAKDVRGVLIYSSDGYMHSLFLRADIPEYTPMDAALPEQYQAVGAGIYAYMAPYELGEKLENGAQVIYHRNVQFAVPPNWIGSTQVRHCTMIETTKEDGSNGLEIEMRADAPLPADRKGVVREPRLRFFKKENMVPNSGP